MSMPIAGVLAVAPTTPTAASGLLGATGTNAVSTGADAFGQTLSGVMDGIQSLQDTSNQLAVQAVTGDLTDIHDATIAQTRATLAVEIASSMRDKGVEAFNSIMQMQV